MNLNDLFDDCLLDIFAHLPLDNLFLLGRVCPRWRSLKPLAIRKRAVRLYTRYYEQYESITKSCDDVKRFGCQLVGAKEGWHFLEKSSFKLDPVPEQQPFLDQLVRTFPYLRKLELFGRWLSLSQMEFLLCKHWTAVEQFTYVADNGHCDRLLMTNIVAMLNPNKIRHLALAVGNDTDAAGSSSVANRCEYIPEAILDSLESLFLCEYSLKSVVNFTTDPKLPKLKHLALVHSRAGFNYLRRKIFDRLRPEDDLLNRLTHLTLHLANQAAIELINLSAFSCLQYLDISFLHSRPPRNGAFFAHFLGKMPPSLVHLRLDICPNCLVDVLPVASADNIAPIKSVRTVELFVSVVGPMVEPMKALVKVFPNMTYVRVNEIGTWL